MKYTPFVAYILTIVGANWAITHFGVVPVGFGLYAPAGVYLAGFAFTFRNLTQQTLGRRFGFAAIGIGAVLSALTTDRVMLGGWLPLWLASGVAFATSERLPRARAPWVLDSGGFSELSMFGEWRTASRAYVASVERYVSEVGLLTWAAVQDWMCEPWILKKTGFDVREHQYRSVISYLELMLRAPHIPWCPVIQGWEASDYLQHGDMYERAGVRLADLPVVGIGSICRRQGTRGAIDVLAYFAKAGVRVHGFGLKTTAVRGLASLLSSADSMAWSYGAMKKGLHCGQPPVPCANHMHYALEWRDDVLASFNTVPLQLGLPLDAFDSYKAN
jgi:hypothetical protein